jgi:hypothetical protein
MATRYDRNRQQWVTEFEQTGIRVYRRHPRGIGKPQAEAWEVKRRREIYDRVDLDRKPDLTIGDAIDLWLQDNRRKNQKQALRSKAVGAVAGKAAEGLPRGSGCCSERLDHIAQCPACLKNVRYHYAHRCDDGEPGYGRCATCTGKMGDGCSLDNLCIRTGRKLTCGPRFYQALYYDDHPEAIHSEPPADDAKSRLQSNVASEAHTGEPERADTDAAGAAAQGRSIGRLSFGNWGAGLDRAQSLGITSPHSAIFAWGYDSGIADKKRKAKERTAAAKRKAFSTAVAVSAFTALLLGIAQAIYRG